ncbi:hypothetical protein N2152v2_000906 [Parachlorella kessleri]
MSLGRVELFQGQKPAEAAAFAFHATEGEVSHGSLHREDFEQWVLKVAHCPLKSAHDWSTCPYLHDGETKARRRCPRTFAYTSIACPSMKQEGFCPLGDTCPFAHNDFEYWLHHTRYHTSLCKKGESCDRKFCFFAHTLCELRRPLARPKLPPGSLAAAAVLRRPQRERSGSPSAALAAARQRARLAAAVASPGVEGPLARSSSSSCVSRQESSAGGMQPGVGIWEGGVIRPQGTAAHQQQQVQAAGTLGGHQYNQVAGGASSGVRPSAAAGAMLALSLTSAPAFPILPFQTPVHGSGSPPQPTTPSSLDMVPSLGLTPGGSWEQSGTSHLPEAQGGFSKAAALDEAGKAVHNGIATQLSLGRIDAGTAISIVNRILGSPALTHLSAVLEAQAQELLAAAPAAQALSWALAPGLAAASAAPPALPLHALLQAQQAQRAPHAAQSASWDLTASALALEQLAGSPIPPCGTARSLTTAAWPSTSTAVLAPRQAAGSSFLGQAAVAGASLSAEAMDSATPHNGHSPPALTFLPPHLSLVPLFGSLGDEPMAGLSGGQAQNVPAGGVQLGCPRACC